MNDKKIIFFDLDGTLLPGNSWYQFNLHFGMTETEDMTLFSWYERGIITYAQWDDIIVNILKEKNRCTKEKFLAFLPTIELRPEAAEIIATCREKGYTTVILSGTMAQIAESVRERIGADASYTTSKIIFDANGAFETIENDKDEAAAKLRIFERVCGEYGVDPETTICVGDSGNDIGMFTRSSRAVLLGNYETLVPLAWKQINSLTEIAELI